MQGVRYDLLEQWAEDIGQMDDAVRFARQDKAIHKGILTCAQLMSRCAQNMHTLFVSRVAQVEVRDYHYKIVFLPITNDFYFQPTRHISLLVGGYERYEPQPPERGTRPVWHIPLHSRVSDEWNNEDEEYVRYVIWDGAPKFQDPFWWADIETYSWTSVDTALHGGEFHYAESERLQDHVEELLNVEEGCREHGFKLGSHSFMTVTIRRHLLFNDITEALRVLRTFTAEDGRRSVTTYVRRFRTFEIRLYWGSGNRVHYKLDPLYGKKTEQHGVVMADMRMILRGTDEDPACQQVRYRRGTAKAVAWRYFVSPFFVLERKKKRKATVDSLQWMSFRLLDYGDELRRISMQEQQKGGVQPMNDALKVIGCTPTTNIGGLFKLKRIRVDDVLMGL